MDVTFLKTKKVDVTFLKTPSDRQAGAFGAADVDEGRTHQYLTGALRGVAVVRTDFKKFRREG